MLSDTSILEALQSGAIGIEPWKQSYIKPSSYDVHLGSKILVPVQPVDSMWLDPSRDEQPMHEADLQDYYSKIEQFIAPGECMLACLDEQLALNANTIAADIAGCSSLGRWFLFVHVTAGFVDAGWDGRLTLELYNASPWHIRIWAGMRIAQLRFYMMPKPSLRPYGKIDSHYFMSQGPVAARYKDDDYVSSASYQQ